MPIPKLIHFIWAGGEKLLPEINANRIRVWAAKHPCFNVYLWIDRATTSTETLAQYNSRYHFDEISNITLKDITEERVVDEFSRYHLDKLMPNYGASSDLLRYRILCEFGGAYFDSDVETSDEKYPLNYDGLFDSPEKSILRLTHYTQHHYALGNDALICTPQHPFMLALYAEAKSNHDTYLMSEFNPYESRAKWRSTFDSTIQMTGPGALVIVCKKLDMLSAVATTEPDPHTTRSTINNVVYYQKTKDAQLVLSQTCYQNAAINDVNWLKSSIRMCELEEATRITIACIQFEVTHFGILCLDDHVEHIANSTGLSEEKETLAKQLVEALKLSAINLEHCKVVQLVSRYSCISEFYSEFTPNLLDGSPSLSDTALNKLLSELDELHGQSVIQYYFAHVTAYLKKSADHNAISLITTHLHSIVINYFSEKYDLLSASTHISLLKNNVLRTQETDYLNNIIAMLTLVVSKLLSADESVESLLNKALYDHLCKYPHQRPIFTYLLHRLTENKVVFNGERITLSKESNAIAVILSRRLAMWQKDFNAIIRAQNRERNPNMFFSRTATPSKTEEEVCKNTRVMTLQN